MILTPISHDALASVLRRFDSGLHEPAAREAFAEIRATSPDRAEGLEAEAHRLTAIALARSQGMGISPPGATPQFNWDGAALNIDTEAYVILHETAHFVLAPPERRGLIDFGLGPGPDTLDREAAERETVLSMLARDRDEAQASLLGILWEARLGQPALASFLDQNWLEGLDRSAAAHFSTVIAELASHGLLALDPRQCVVFLHEAERRRYQSEAVEMR